MRGERPARRGPLGDSGAHSSPAPLRSLRCRADRRGGGGACLLTYGAPPAPALPSVSGRAAIPPLARESSAWVVFVGGPPGRTLCGVPSPCSAPVLFRRFGAGASAVSVVEGRALGRGSLPSSKAFSPPPLALLGPLSGAEPERKETLTPSGAGFPLELSMDTGVLPMYT